MPGDRAPWEQPRLTPKPTMRVAGATRASTLHGTGQKQLPALIAGIGGAVLVVIIVVTVANLGPSRNRHRNSQSDPRTAPTLPTAPEKYDRPAQGDQATKAYHEFRAKCETMVSWVNEAYVLTGRVPDRLTGSVASGGSNIPESGLGGEFVRFEDKVVNLGNYPFARYTPGRAGSGISVRLTAKSVGADQKYWYCLFEIGDNLMTLSSS